MTSENPDHPAAQAAAIEPAGTGEDAGRGPRSSTASAYGSHRASTAALALSALGIVFGDIGTSPLYALHTVFAANDNAIEITRQTTYGVISMVVWAITMVVSVKYVTFVMRADNDGEGGILALIALIRRIGQRSGGAPSAALVGLGIFGAALFFGDAMITPAISVLSADEGLGIISPSLESLVLPISLAVLAGLFAAQRLGTRVVGRLFGPVCAIWFLALGLGGAAQVERHPEVLAALSPTYGVAFAAAHPLWFFIALSGVVLTITGVEALYADMGHFGRRAITSAWFFVVFPALTLNYMGQATLILHDHAAVENPFFLLFPHWARIPMVVLATAATVIASQAVISGAFSVARQAVQLGFLPRMTIHHTSADEIGQVYLPAINWGLLVAVVVLVLGFGSSANLAVAYGIAVTGTLVIDTLLFSKVARSQFRKPLWIVAVGTAVFLAGDLLFFSANLPKVLSGGWFPLGIAVLVFCVLTTWNRGRELVTARRTSEEGPLRAFIDDIHEMDPPIHRVAGTAVFLNANAHTTPLALRANVEHNHTLHKSVVIVTIEILPVPFVPEPERVTVDDLGYSNDGIVHITARYGFKDKVNVPDAIGLAQRRGLEAHVNLASASYFVSRLELRRGRGKHMASWRTALFLTMSRHAANPVQYFNLPIDRTVVMGAQITI